MANPQGSGVNGEDVAKAIILFGGIALGLLALKAIMEANDG
ncbi:MAG: hypothetical protein V4510_03620 [bacterium]